jgi:CBS domain containing-hemolysin-like protein
MMMTTLVPIGIVVVLILLNGLFVAAEFALIATSRAWVEGKASLGDKSARKLRKILASGREQDRYIATAQLGITLASLALGMYGEYRLALWLESHFGFLSEWVNPHTIASTLAIVFLTYLHIVIGEMVPKSLAIQKAEVTSLWIMRPMTLAQRLFYPLAVLLNGLGNLILRAMRFPRDVTISSHSSEELEYVIRESQEGGLLRKETSEVLQDLLEFSDLKAREVMVPRVRIVGLPLGSVRDDVAEIVREDTHTRYPVYDGDLDNIIGVIHVKDMLKEAMFTKPISQEDIRPVPYVPETAHLDSILETMRKNHAQMVVVKDEYGGTAGLIAMEDLFEEVVGNIDESTGKAPIQVRRDGSLRADGLVRLEELGEKLDIDLEHEDVDTVGGLIMTILGRIPLKGDTVEYKGLRFVVSAVEGHSVSRCKIYIMSEAAPEANSD